MNKACRKVSRFALGSQHKSHILVIGIIVFVFAHLVAYSICIQYFVSDCDVLLVIRWLSIR